MSGTYWICFLIVNANKTKKYTTRIGQYTGTSNNSENVQTNAMRVARVDDSLFVVCIRQLFLNILELTCSPELPFRQSSHKWPELIVSRTRQPLMCFLATFFDLVGKQVVLKGRVEFGLQEC
jgi:hypothetical protein